MLLEEGHFYYGDSFWVSLRYLISAIFFYNPVIWFAFKYSDYVCELACDETVMSRIAFAERKQYGNCLLDVIRKNEKVSERVLLSTNMKSEEKLIRIRIENIVSNKKNSVWMMLLTSLLLILIFGCALMENKSIENVPKQNGEYVKIAFDEDFSMENIGRESKKSEITEEVSDMQSESSEKNERLSKDVIGYDDTVYLCVEMLKKLQYNDTYEVVIRETEIELIIANDYICYTGYDDRVANIMEYVAKECLGKSVGDTLGIIQMISEEEYYFDFLITSINESGDLDFAFPANWDYGFSTPTVGEFFEPNDLGTKFGFAETEGIMSVPLKSYAKATATSQLSPIDNIGYSYCCVTKLRLARGCERLR